MRRSINSCCHEWQLSKSKPDIQVQQHTWYKMSSYCQHLASKSREMGVKTHNLWDCSCLLNYFVPPTPRSLGSQRKEEGISPAKAEPTVITCTLSLHFPSGKCPYGPRTHVILFSVRRKVSALKEPRGSTERPLCRLEVWTRAVHISFLRTHWVSLSLFHCKMQPLLNTHGNHNANNVNFYSFGKYGRHENGPRRHPHPKPWDLLPSMVKETS